MELDPDRLQWNPSKWNWTLDSCEVISLTACSSFTGRDFILTVTL